MSETKLEGTGQKLQDAGQKLQDAGKNITCGCLSVVFLAIIGFLLYSVIAS